MNAGAATHPLQWLREHDRDFAALRRAGRAAIVMPAMFAIGDKVIGESDARDVRRVRLVRDAAAGRLRRPDARAAAEPGRARAWSDASFVCLGTLASQNVPGSRPRVMALVGFAVLFAGVVSSVLASATTALLLAFILPVTLAAPLSSIPDRARRLGAGSRRGAASPSALLWPAPARDPLRGAATAACRALAARLRADVAYLLSGAGCAVARPSATRPSQQAEAARGRAAAARFSPRPTGRRA